MNANTAERPVFLDPTGRRARVVRRLGRVGAALTTAWLAAMLFALGSGSALPALPATGTVAHSTSVRPAATETAPAPARRSRPPNSASIALTHGVGHGILATASVRG